VEGGELFDRIIDENYNLTELDTILFIKQICEGIRHMHQMYILHLDLKVEWLSILTNTESSQLFPKCLLGALSAIYQLRKFLLLLLMFLGTNKNLDFFFLRWDLAVFPRLAMNSWVQAILLS
jgi:serine/threonine protein kinase